MSSSLSKFAATRAPVDFGARLVDDFIEGARSNSFGRPVNVQFAVKGASEALQKHAVNGATVGHIMDLAGLGMLAAPVVHDLVGNPEHESETVRKLKSGTELAGLGVLTAPSLIELLSKKH